MHGVRGTFSLRTRPATLQPTEEQSEFIRRQVARLQNELVATECAEIKYNHSTNNNINFNYSLPMLLCSPCPAPTYCCLFVYLFHLCVQHVLFHGPFHVFDTFSNFPATTKTTEYAATAHNHHL